MGRRLRITFACLLAALALGVVVLVLGFVEYAGDVALLRPDLSRKADAIVAPTGGVQRIDDAVQLLLAGRGRRLLISGVNNAVSDRDLIKAIPQAAALIACCIDLDYRALNTAGNAQETAKWASRNGFSSLIVVTSDYHLPRVLLELKRESPSLTLIGHPVRSQAFMQDNWWRKGAILRLLLSEYSKYVLARLQVRLDRSLAGPTAAR